jgi:hypothetical protein
MDLWGRIVTIGEVSVAIESEEVIEGSSRTHLERSTAERRSVTTPFLGMCERCQIKFFTPRELTRRPAEAERYLRQKFSSHVCKDEGRTPMQPIHKV